MKRLLVFASLIVYAISGDDWMICETKCEGEKASLDKYMNCLFKCVD